MATNINRKSFIVSQDGLIAFKLSQLSPAISNSKVAVRGMFAIPIFLDSSAVLFTHLFAQ